jgi:hypothetical protein
MNFLLSLIYKDYYTLKDMLWNNKEVKFRLHLYYMKFEEKPEIWYNDWRCPRGK